MTRMCLLVCWVALLVAPALAAEEENEKKKPAQKGQRSGATQILTQLKEVGLTDEQVTKVKALSKETNAKMKSLRTKVGITPELMKKRAELQKKLRESGKKGGELLENLNRESGFDDKQSQAVKEMNQLRQKLRAEIVSLLTKEQKAKLPEGFSRGLNPKGKAAKGKGDGAKGNAKKKSVQK